MTYVIIKYKAKTLDNKVLPLFLYAEPLFLFEENKDNICVKKGNQLFWFDKSQIQKSI